MAKLRFRLRISRVIPSFYSCRSKDSTATATCPTSNPSSHTATSFNLSPFHHRHTHHHLLRPSFSSGGEADAEADDLPLARGIDTNYLWTRSEKWHVISCASSENSFSSSSPPRSKIDSNLFASRNPRCTRESDSSDDDSGWFSSDEEYNYENYDNYKKISTARGTREISCFAVSKVSANPRGDFRRSMAEMVVERGIYDVEGLKRLLHCFLSLNEHRHHQVILTAFADVWYAIFPSVALAATFPNMFYKS